MPYYSLDSLLRLEVMNNWQCSAVRAPEQMLALYSKTVFRRLLC